MKKQISLSLLLLMNVLLFSCEEENVIEEVIVTSENLNFTVSYDESMDNTVYPSLILGLSNYFAKDKKDLELIDYSLTVPKDNVELKVELSSSTINNRSVFQETLLKSGVESSYKPMISWDFEKLKTLNQAGNVDLNFTCYIDGNEIDNKTLRLNYRSVNECVYGMFDENGKYVDLSYMFAAYVNEDHPKIDEVLQRVLQTGLVDSFIGYQGGTEESVINQVYAIWYYLQTKGVKYSSITNTSNPSDKVFTQHVRFFDEVYESTQANCVDGSVFLSSILKKIGIKPFLVLVPGHMYLGFYTNAEKTAFRLLETTMVGHVDQNKIYEDGQYVYGLEEYRHLVSDDTYYGYFNGVYSLEMVKQEISWNNFIQSIEHQNENWNQNLDKFNNQDEIQHKTFDIEALRQVVQPIGR